MHLPSLYVFYDDRGMRVCTFFMFSRYYKLFFFIYILIANVAPIILLLQLLQTVNSSHLYTRLSPETGGQSLSDQTCLSVSHCNDQQTSVFFPKSTCRIILIFFHCRYLLNGERPTVRVLRRTAKYDS